MVCVESNSSFSSLFLGWFVGVSMSIVGLPDIIKVLPRSNKQKDKKETKKEDHTGGTGINVSSCGGDGFEAFFQQVQDMTS